MSALCWSQSPPEVTLYDCMWFESMDTEIYLCRHAACGHVLLVFRNSGTSTLDYAQHMS